MLSAGSTEGLQYTTIFEGIGPIVVTASVSIWRPEAAAVIAALPALYVVWNRAVAKVLPAGTSTLSSTLPISTLEEDSWTRVEVDGCCVIVPDSSRS